LCDVGTEFCKSIVAYLRYARTVTSKHAPAITQQQTKRCFLRAEPSSAEPSRAEPRRERVANRAASPRLCCCQATAINTWMTQE
jgi:hypothetical protein